MPRYLNSLIVLIAASALTHGATVISRDNTRHEGTIVENNSDGVKLKVKMGTLEAFVNVARADILEIQNTPERVNPVEASAKELLDDAEFAMQAKKPKDAAAAWAKLGALYKSTPGYSSKAKEAFENALVFDPENAAALAQGYSPTVRSNAAVVAVNRANVNDAAVNAAPVVGTVAPLSSSSVDGALGGRSLRFDADRYRDNVVRTMLAQGMGNPPTETPSFDTPYPARANTSYTNSNSYNYSDGYRPRHASNCSPNRWSIFPCSVSIPGVTVTSSNPTYVVGGGYYPQQTPQYYCQRTPQSYNTPNTYTPNTYTPNTYTPNTGTYTPPTYTYSRPPQTSMPNTPTTTTTILPPSQPYNGSTQPNRPPPVTTTTTFRPQHGNNGLGNGVDPQPPGNPPPNDLTGSRPGNPGNSHRARRY